MSFFFFTPHIFSFHLFVCVYVFMMFPYDFFSKYFPFHPTPFRRQTDGIAIARVAAAGVVAPRNCGSSRRPRAPPSRPFSKPPPPSTSPAPRPTRRSHRPRTSNWTMQRRRRRRRSTLGCTCRCATTACVRGWMPHALRPSWPNRRSWRRY
jgi:hypothetical protein